MSKNIRNSAIVMVMLLGMLFVTAIPNEALAQSCRRRSGYQSAYYNDGRYNDGRYNDGRYNDDRRFDDRGFSRRYRNPEDTTGNALKRTGIGGGIGALGGALIGGKKGALIGAGIGAAGGYIYHRSKVNKERDRFFR